ncbi:MAG: hypothetical protein LR008_01755, partial [Candidatus Pacebacteria bacterium]|nr:hypothetical protein [Candidatus Paceibacterota bacterium]
ITTAIAVVILSGILLLPNRDIILQLFSSDILSLGTKLSFVFSLYGAVALNYGVLSIMYMVSIAVLFGINVSLLTYYIRRRQIEVSGKTAHVTSIGGLISGIFGIGCAACGSIILTSVLGLFGATGLLLLLPFHGAEFGVIGIILLAFSINYLVKKIDDPFVCPA